MTGREKAAAGGAAVLALGITGYSAWKLIGTGILSWHVAQPEFHSMMAELPVVWLMLFLIFFYDGKAVRRECDKESVRGECDGKVVQREYDREAVRGECDEKVIQKECDGKTVRRNCGGETIQGSCEGEATWGSRENAGTDLDSDTGRYSWRAWCGVAVAAAVFCWLHVSFLPMVFAAGYAEYLILAGGWFRETIMRAERGRFGKKAFGARLCWDFLLGCAVTISVFCLLSLGNLGSIKKLRLWVLGSGVLLIGRAVRKWMIRDGVQPNRRAVRKWMLRDGMRLNRRAVREQRSGKGALQAAMTAAVLTLVFLQAGRMNLAVDFDSIWYGVRSHVMLDSGNGIYENLGTLGVVYTYPKGFETLTLPLAGLPSYSFITAFNVITAGMTLLAAFETAAVFMSRPYVLWVPFLMAAVPGVMNMADTAKADLMTLFCQLLMLQGVMRYWREMRGGWLALALAAGGVSLTMKPTAVVFSTAIVGMSMFYLVWEWFTGRVRLKEITWGKSSCWLAVLPAATAVLGIWGRTLKLVGVPVTSVFYQVFQKMGFRVKYPFYASGFPSAGSGMSAAEGLHFLAGRLYGVLINPQGDDMGHVIIAWGTVLPVVLVAFFLCFSGVKKGQDVCRELRYLAVMLAALLFIDLVSLYSLSQIDGNYYMLTYAVWIILGCGWLAKCTDFCRKSAYMLLIPVWLYGAVLCGLTNWAWALGNGGIQAVNRGYYPHTEAEREKRAAQGSQAIWEILAADPKNRVIALGEHPGVLTFPCWVQSYVDVSGYWGNPEVVADAPSFLEYLQFARVNYLYMEKEYIDTSVRIYQIVRNLVERGWLYDVRDENGNLILSVNHPEENAGESYPAGSAEEIYQNGTGLAAEEIQRNLQIFDQRYIQHP